MTLTLILLVAVLAAHPCIGAEIPDDNEKSNPSLDLDERLPTVVFRSVTNSTQVNANMMNDRARPENVTLPPRTAMFLTECDTPASSWMSGLCWMDETTVLMLDYFNGGRIIKFEIDIKLRLCLGSVLYTNVPGYRLSCTPDGEIYIADGANKVVRIIKHGNITEWKPYSDPGAAWGGIAANDDIIALDFYKRPVNLYNNTRQRQFMYELIRSEADNYNTYHLSISPSSSHLVASAYYDHYIFIHDLINNHTIKVGGPGNEGGKLYQPWGTAFDASEQYVMVCQFVNNRISIFNMNGTFIHVLEMDPGGSQANIDQYIVTIHREGKPSLLAVDAVKGKGVHSIKIYSLST